MTNPATIPSTPEFDAWWQTQPHSPLAGSALSLAIAESYREVALLAWNAAKEPPIITCHVDAIASLLLSKKGYLSQPHLHRLMYYCQALHLVWYNQPLFRSRIEAWAAGPVVLDFFDRHSSSTGFTTMPDIEIIADLTVYKRAHAITDAIIAAYGTLSAQQLNDITRSEDPYRLIAPAPSTVVSPKPAISPESMRAYYLQKWSTPRTEQLQKST